MDIRNLCAQVVAALDCKEFQVTSREAFLLLKCALFRANRPLPQSAVADFFYKRWSHALGQLSLLHHCWAFPDVICLSDLPHRSTDLSYFLMDATASAAAPTDQQSSVQLW